MDEAYDNGSPNQESSDSSFEDDIDSIALLPERKTRPRRLRRRRIRIFEDNGGHLRTTNRMCSRRTIVYSTITAVLLICVVIISVFVNPSTSDEFEEKTEKRSSEFQDEPEKKDDSSFYKDGHGRKFAWQKIRLPSSVTPEEYTVILRPKLDPDFTFSGNVSVRVKCNEDTDYIFIHAKQMRLTKFEVLNQGKEPLKIMETANCEKLEMFSIKVKGGLKKGESYVLQIDFNAVLAEKLTGFYKSSYKDKDGNTRYLATTHFEPTDARAAFPCFDEPALKAVFNMVIYRKAEHVSLSNMPIKETFKDKESGQVIDVFEPSVKMSTYLVAFVVCDFKSKEATTKRGTLVRVWAPEDNIDEGDYALSEAVKILSYYEKFFAVRYPLPKQDLIAIPDFPTGAMENWGLITYRMTSLLYRPGFSSDDNKQWISVVVAHELAHQWFGNLVTMKWWNDLWLNEGFASFVENIGVNHTTPEWRMMEQFLLDKTQLSMNLDQLSNSHPISVVVKDPAEINSLFDTISYDKGAAIIRMLKSFLGDDVFQKGLQKYLNKHKFGNAETNQLWDAFTEESSVSASSTKNFRDVKSVMDTWTLQMGFPVVTIKQRGDSAVASQKHFRIHPKVKPSLRSQFDYKWIIPFTYYTQNDKTKKNAWIEKDNGREGEGILQFDYNPATSGWIKANYEQHGFYRVNYDAENWERLKQQLDTDHEKLSAADRAGLLDDAFNLARAGELPLTTALDLTKYLTKEEMYVPWAAALSNMGFLESRLCENEEHMTLYKKYALQQLKHIVRKLGWDDKGSHLQKYLRSYVLKLCARYGDVECATAVKSRFDDWMRGESLPPNLRSVIYDTGVHLGGEKEFKYMYEQYNKSTVAAEKRKLLFAMSATQNPALMKKLLDMSMSTQIRSQDTVSVITSVASNCKGRNLAWDFVKKHWKTLFKRYGHGSFDFARLVSRTTTHFSTPQKLKEIQEFFKKHELGSGKLASKQAEEGVSSNIDWMKNNTEVALKWLEEHTGAESKPADGDLGVANVERLENILAPEGFQEEYQDRENQEEPYQNKRYYSNQHYGRGDDQDRRFSNEYNDDDYEPERRSYEYQ
ncbi:glutamyl aminopeptidase isoform X2 [Nematostella vectensis]|uniref:glutamyl aminopeptidase isoform X2 n=1 Tax=Nematostella vectensis TaxID=45351 RepID=UPI00207726B0|nr:glutamyl aminopeptidase isoform X2 [Nematostella vectensis]